MKLDAEKLRMSGILALKDLFREFPGKSTVELQFIAGADRRLGTVSIDSQWGVKATPAFFEKLRTLSFIN